MFHVIAILYTLFWSFPSDDIDVSYNSALEAIVINGLDKNELKDSDYDVSVYFGVVSVSPEIPKIIGNYESVASQTLYKSKYGFSNGTSYTVLITSNNKSKSQYRFVVTIPKETLNSSTYVTMVYPTTDKLPMNQLKLYISFSESMKTGNAFEYIHLYKMPEGKLEEDAFLKFSDELWDTQRKRLTILFDPGRIKPGLQPNLQMGLPLVEGQKYKLVIDESWLDNNGAQLVKGYEKTFEVIAQDKTAPNKDNWEISFPKQDSKNENTKIKFFFIIFSLNEMKIVASTIDDSFGESFDKVAKMLKLGYPGGPVIQEYALKGDENKYELPIPLRQSPKIEFSYSGLKNAVRLLIEKCEPIDEQKIADIAACFQKAAVTHIMQKTKKLFKIKAPQNFAIVGGASANIYLRTQIEELCQKYNTNLYLSELKYCSDNAAMIGRVAIEQYKIQEFISYEDIDIQSRLKAM